MEEKKTIEVETKKDKKKTFAVIAIILAAFGFLITNVLPDGEINYVIGVAVAATLVEVGAIVFGILGLKGNRTLAIIAIVIGAIWGGFTLLGGLGLSFMTQATDCVPSKTPDTYTCKFQGQDIEVPKSYLRDDQIKK